MQAVINCHSLNVQSNRCVLEEAWKKSESESCSVVSKSSRIPGQNTGVGSPSLLQGIFPTQGLNPGLPHCRQILYQLSHKSKNTGVGSLTLLQQIFTTQESNKGLLHCRWILYQLSCQESPKRVIYPLWGSNSRPSDYKTDGLPSVLRGQTHSLTRDQTNAHSREL